MTRRELLAAGYTDADIRTMSRRRRLTQLRRGWYSTGSADPAVAAAVRSGGVLACVSALGRRGIWVPPADGHSHVRASTYGRASSARSYCSAYGGLPAPTQAVDAVPEAVACAARCLPAEMFVAVCDSVLFRDPGLDVADLAGFIPGAPQRLRRLLDHVDRRAESGTESLVRYRLRRRGIAVRIQEDVPHVGRVDLLVGRCLVIECDSRTYHLGDAYYTDRARDRAALWQEYGTFRVTYEDVLFDWPAVEEQILDIVRSRRHLRPPRPRLLELGAVEVEASAGTRDDNRRESSLRPRF
ncbi:hypothetical protein GCM10023147_30290 [Tsukamurella soli]|uniref:Very-short-patch-repair endonuclease n=2 Tax=Tsukamurella soli TaxID=644556 RepID=A0ABP8JV44_9ACTN